MKKPLSKLDRIIITCIIIISFAMVLFLLGVINHIINTVTQ
jgi:hypothetical protein